MSATGCDGRVTRLTQVINTDVTEQTIFSAPHLLGHYHFTFFDANNVLLGGIDVFLGGSNTYNQQPLMSLINYVEFIGVVRGQIPIPMTLPDSSNTFYLDYNNNLMSISSDSPFANLTIQAEFQPISTQNQ